ncbi:energy-coupling factor ABC transporter ATP-binding protein [Corynebacterium epidermidicanis]|uniref:ABC-type cobalt transport system, ATPase component n=1 Tax=Corynebacterium epidermidicanis TaxID=1050174 RepID=A0A0G3GWX2_9CORY|nr:ABC transporter ATP-binding protein [Corynebacterium epidermidicanis]AKK03352.1 ABC-type cobalt transport system, ATPase component [Corynebacterium epidermidicanis]
MPTITFDHVSVQFGDRTVLRDINLTLSERRIGIIGANGGGKSSLVRLINGLAEPTSGSVLVDDLSVASHGKEVRKRVGFVFSDADNQIIMPTVIEDIEFSLRRKGLSKSERREAALAMLERFGLADHASDSPHTLSGGQKQLLALAAVLILSPELVIADEPTTLLDLRNRNGLQETFHALTQQLIVVSHDLDFLGDFDRVVCIDDQQVAADGHPNEVIAFYRRLMGQG